MVPPENSGSSQGARTKSIVSSRRILSGAPGGGSRWTPSKSGCICAKTSLKPRRWGTCNGTSPISRRWTPSSARPSRGAFRCLYGPARTPPVQLRFSAHVDVAPRAGAQVALDQVRHRHQKTVRELTPGDIRAITGWVTPAQPLGFAHGNGPKPTPHSPAYWQHGDGSGPATVLDVAGNGRRRPRHRVRGRQPLHAG